MYIKALSMETHYTETIISQMIRCNFLEGNYYILTTLSFYRERNFLFRTV